GWSEPRTKIHNWDDFPAKVDDAFDQIRSARDRGNLRHTHNFAHGCDADAVRFIADAKTDDLTIFFHREVSGPLGTNQFSVFVFLRTVRLTATTLTAVGFATARTLLVGAVENKAVHAVEQIARELEHLFSGGGQLGGTGSGLLDQFAHFVHGADNGLCAGSLFLDGGIDFLGNFRKAAGSLGNLRRADRLLVGGGADFLRELVHFGDDVGNLVKSGA